MTPANNLKVLIYNENTLECFGGQFLNWIIEAMPEQIGDMVINRDSEMTIRINKPFKIDKPPKALNQMLKGIYPQQNNPYHFYGAHFINPFQQQQSVYVNPNPQEPIENFDDNGDWMWNDNDIE